MDSLINDILNKTNINFNKLVHKDRDLYSFNINAKQNCLIFSNNDKIVKCIKIKNVTEIISRIVDNKFVILDESIAELINNIIIKNYNSTNNSHFVNIYDIWYKSNNIYIEMEHLKYSFHNIIKTYQQKLYHEPVYLLSIFFQIIFMIYQLQKINFVHYDLKRENIRFKFTNDKNISYKYYNINFNVPCLGYTAHCFDFGTSIFKLNDMTVTNQIIFENKLLDTYNIDSNLNLNYDLHFFFQDFTNAYGDYFPWIYDFINDIGIKVKSYDIRHISSDSNIKSINDIILSNWFKPFRSYNNNFTELNLRLVSKQFDNDNELPSNTPILNE